MGFTNLALALSGNYRVTFPGLGIDDGIEISRVVIRIGSVEIYWYGLLIASAVLLAMFLSVRHAPQFNLNGDDVLDFYLWTIPVGIIGARIYYVIFAWDEFSHNFWSIFDTRNGGLAFYGGIITGALTVFIVGKIKKISFPRVAHFFIPYVPLGQAIGRWGNFFNQEAFGTNTTLPWGMYSNGTRNYLLALNDPSLDPNMPVHPTFFYEFLGNMIIFFFLLRVRKRTKDGFEPLAWYLILYGTLRFFVERIRTDSLYIGDSGIRVSAALSAVMVVAGIAYLIYINSGSKRSQRRVEMAAMLTAEPLETHDTESVRSSHEVDTDEVKILDDVATEVAEQIDGERLDAGSLDGELVDTADDAIVSDLDMDRVIREAREAAARALGGDAADANADTEANEADAASDENLD